MKKILHTRLSSKGFTLLEILVVTVIIVILVGAGAVSYMEVERRAKEKLCAERLQTIATYEKFYAREFGEYGDFINLQDQGYIDPNFVAEDNLSHSNGPPFAPDYILEFVVPGDGTYRVDAVSVVEETDQFSPRWRGLGGIWDLRTMYIDDRGIVRWEENDQPIF